MIEKFNAKFFKFKVYDWKKFKIARVFVSNKLILLNKTLLP
jgi:hypothetical protein